MNTRLVVFFRGVGTTAEISPQRLHLPDPLLPPKEQDEVCKGQGKHQAAQQFVLSGTQSR